MAQRQLTVNPYFVASTLVRTMIFLVIPTRVRRLSIHVRILFFTPI
jgi:hypothetical protein